MDANPNLSGREKCWFQYDESMKQAKLMDATEDILIMKAK